MADYKKIKFAMSGFNPGDAVEFSDIPQPAKKYVPDWYRDTPLLRPDNIDEPGKRNFKHCMPFADAFLSGYMLTTICDILIDLDQFGKPKISFPNGMTPFSSREKYTAGQMPVPEDCHDTHFIWYHPMHIKTPKGYGVLITHPLNRHDLPFYSLSGVVDTDIDAMHPGQYPFFLKKNFKGLIPKGTPIVQIIPIKRDSWESEKDTSLLTKDWMEYLFKVRSVFSGFYKKNIWQKKSYN